MLASMASKPSPIKVAVSACQPADFGAAFDGARVCDVPKVATISYPHALLGHDMRTWPALLWEKYLRQWDYYCTKSESLFDHN